MGKFNRLLRFLLDMLLAIATLGGAVLAYVQYRNEYGEPIGNMAKWISPYLLCIPFWCWLGITITGVSGLFLIGWWSKLNKIGKSPPQAPYDHELRHGMRRRLLFSRFTKRYRELVASYLCTRGDPRCACVHGGAMLLGATWSPFTLFRIIVWLRQKLASPSRGFSYPPELLRRLTEALQIQVDKRRWFWPKTFHRTFHQVTMDTYNSVAYYGVETLRKSMFLVWQHGEVRRHWTEDLQNASLEYDSMVKCQHELGTEGRNFMNAAWDLFETIGGSIHPWLASLDTPIEVEEAILKQIIPTLFALPIREGLSDDQLARLAPKMQQLAKGIVPVVWRSSQDCGLEVWRRRVYLVFRTGVLIYIIRWLDTDDKQIVLGRTWDELELLYQDGGAQNIRSGDVDQIFVQFDQEIETILSGTGGFDITWVQNIANRVESLSKQARAENALPIATICESVNQKLRNILNPVE